MTILITIAVTVITLALAPGMYRSLKAWRARQRSEWELDRAAWRLWMARP
jgi:hypothetical protein